MDGIKPKKTKEQPTTGHMPDAELLIQNEQRYRLTLDNLLEGCQIIDFDWRYFYINPAAANQGRKTQGELLHHTMMEIYPGVEKRELFAVMQDCMENRVAHRLDKEFIYPEGDAGWFELIIQPVPEGIFILSIDITRRKQSDAERIRIEESILRSQERLNTVVEIEHSLATYLNQEKIYDILTKGICKLFPDIETVLISSFDSTQQIIKAVYVSIKGSLIDVASLPDLPLAPEGLGTQSQVIRSRQPLIINGNFEDQLHQSSVHIGPSERKTESALYVPMIGLKKVLGLIQLQSLSSDRFTDEDARILGLVANTAAVSIQNAMLFESAQWQIHERERVEEALNASLSLLQTIIDTSPVHIFWKDRDSRYLGCNPAFAKDVGFNNPGDIIGKDDYQLCSKMQADQYRADDQQVMNSGIPKISYEEMQTSPNGELLWLRTSKVPLRNNENQIIGILGVYEDITERKRTNEALRNSGNQLSRAIQIAHLGYWEYDIIADLYTFNDQFYSMLRTSASLVGGYRMASAEYSRRFVHPEDSVAVGFEIQQAVETADPKYTRLIEHRIIYGDGQVGYVTVQFFIIKDSQGRTVKTYGVTQDITDRKQAEIALRASEENYRSLIENAESAIAVLDQKGKILYANPKGVKIWNDPQIVGQSIFQIFPQKYAQRYSIAIKKIIKNGVGIVDDVQSLINDRLMWFRLSMNPLKNSNGVVNAILLNAWDITDRKKTEEELQFRNVLLSTQQEASIDGILVVDDKDRILSYNRRFVEMMRVPVHLIESQEDAPVLHHVMDQMIDPQSFLNKVQYIYQHRQETSQDEIILTDGHVFDRYSSPMFGSDERYFGRIWYFRDITTHKQAEREINQRNDDLLLIQALNDADNIEGIADVFAKGTRQLFSCQAVAVYLLSSDGKYLEMRSSTLPIKIRELVERLIGQPIPKIRIPIREDSYIHQILANEQGTLSNDPIEIQQWIMEFTETTFLPSAIRPLIKKFVPQIFSKLNIQSTISMPLISSGQTIGLLDLSSQGEFSEMDLHRLRNISNQMTAVILRKQAESHVRMQLKRLSALTEIDRAITSSLDMRLSLDILLSVVQSQLSVDATAILLFNTFTQKLEYVAGRGFRAPAMRQSQLRLGEGVAGRVGLERKIMHIPDLKEIGKQFARSELLKEEKFVEYYGVPLVAKGLIKGVLEIFHRSHLDPDLEWIDYLETLGGSAAIAIDNAQLFAGMQQSNLELLAAYDATIVGWSLAMDLRDKETEGHSQRVLNLTLKMADRIGISPQEMVNIRRGALLHDIGKLGVPDHILNKPDTLSAEEWIIMRQHPVHAYNMLMPIAYLRGALDIPYCHHEKWDGTGYPRGLKGEEIPLAARIFAIVDVWDALRSVRPYRPNWSNEQVIVYFQEQKGKHFDPFVVELFLELIEDEKEL